MQRMCGVRFVIDIESTVKKFLGDEFETHVAIVDGKVSVSATRSVGFDEDRVDIHDDMRTGFVLEVPFFREGDNLKVVPAEVDFTMIG